MAFVQPLTDQQAPAASQPLLRGIQQQFGMVPNIYRTMAHHPQVLQAVLGLTEAIRQDLPAKYREMAYLAASVLNGCKYCTHYHRMMAKAAGLTESQLEAITTQEFERGFDEQEQAVLRLANQLTETAEVAPELAHHVLGFLSELQYVALVAAIGLANLTNRFNHACGVALP